MANDNAYCYQFGDFTLDFDRGALFYGGAEVRLRPKSFEVLAHLVKRHGKLVAREELLAAIWGHAYGTDASLTQCLIEVRRALGDDDHEMIRTVPRRGFVFELPVVEDSGGETDPAAEGARQSVRAFPAVIGTLVLVMLAFGWWSAERLGWFAPGIVVDRDASEVTSIAVLPFLDMSRGQDQEYLADGLTDELLHALAQISGLRVIARTSSFAFKNKEVGIPQVARQLDVSHVLEGSIKKSGDKIRVIAQLVDAETNSHLWSRTYDRGLEDIFDVQAEIAESVADTLEVTLSESRQAAIARRHDPEAYEHYLKGRFFWHRRAPGDFERAERHYQRAVEIDPEFARAWVGLAGGYMAQTQDPDRRREAVGAMRSALDRALAIDPDLPEAHSRAFAYYLITDREELAWRHWEVADQLGNNMQLYSSARARKRGNQKRVAELSREHAARNPLSAVTQANLGWVLMSVGQYTEAASAFKRANDLNPSIEEHHAVPLNLIKIFQGRYQEAIDGALALPEGRDRDWLLALSYHEAGQRAKAATAMARLEADSSEMSALRVAEVHAFRGNIDAAFEWLDRIPGRVSEEEAIRRWPLWKTTLSVSPCLRPLGEDPRWESTVARMPDYPPIEAEPLQATAKLPR